MTPEFNVDQIRKLRILDLIIENGSLKKAALQARVSPSAVSQSLASLERAVGKPLIVRERGSVRPTSHALEILEIIRPAFNAFERLSDIGRAPAPKMSWLNFGTYESLAIDVLPGLLMSLRERMPNLRLGLRISRTNNLLTLLRKGELCSALITEVDDLEKFHAREVGSDRLGIWVSARQDITWAHVDRVGLGCLAPGRGGPPRYHARFMRALAGPKPILLSDSLETLRAATAAGAIASVLPRRVAEREPGLVEITPPTARGLGAHRLLLVSLANCDLAETEFLAGEVARLL